MEKSPEDIMAEYLLKGGKMLEKTCPSCGSPLFQVKGETVCVVCGGAQKPAAGPAAAGKKIEERKQLHLPEVNASGEIGQGVSGDVDDELEKTVIHLCRRVREERNPEDCLALMECVRIAGEFLKR